MSDTSDILALPYILPAQAQKHVTHNEALRVLDVLVQPTVLATDVTDPPANAASGDRYLVPLGATGDWVGLEGQIAVRQAGAWMFMVPQAGWQVRDVASFALWLYDGATWIQAEGGGGSDTLGVNTAADTDNRLAVSSPATLLTHEGAGHQLKINKASAGDTNALLYQTNWSGRAEMGCAGEDDFSVKVSADGPTWSTALRCDAATGVVSFPSGASTPTQHTIMGRWYCETDNRWCGFSVSHGPQTGNFAQTAGTDAEPSVNWQHYGICVEAGTILRRLKGLFRAPSASVTGYDIRVFFQHGAIGLNWFGNGNTIREEVFAADAVPVSAAWSDLAGPALDYTAPADGSVLIYVRPVGTITARTYIYSTITLDTLLAA
ncbi:MAG: DUF2793 domain-containing protein [Pseudomonadota bacterium]